MKKYKWLIWLVVIVVLLVIVFRKNIFSSAERGGIIYGKSHADGGEIGLVKDKGEILVMEKDEAIVNKKTMGIKNTYQCNGTPAQIISELSVEGGGVKMADGGNCVRI